ncbi:MAG: two-component regulator propeller domain-containing protein [Saonia sp.]
MVKKSSYIVTFLLGAFLSLTAQTKFDELNFIGIDAIISKDAISCIVQEEHGIIWIGTYGSGIYRFDGINYVPYEHDFSDSSSINGNIIHQIYIDSDKRLWVGTDSGLNLYDKNLDRFQEIDIKCDTFIPDHFSATNIIQDNFGNLLVSTYGIGVLKIDLKNFTATKVSSTSENINNILINSFVTNKSGKVLAGTNSGLFEFEEGSNSFKRNSISLKDIPDHTIAIESLLLDDTDNLWIGTHKNGILKVSTIDGIKQTKIFPWTDKKVFSMMTVDNYVLAGTENDGLLVMDREDGSLIQNYQHNESNPKSIASSSIWSLYQDHQERIWVGYYNKGVAVFDINYAKFKSLETEANNENSLQGYSISGIEKDNKGRLWISVKDGLDIYDPKTGLFHHIKSNENTDYSGLNGKLNLQGIFIDSNENLWLATWENGLYLLKKDSKAFINFSTQTTNGILATNSIRCFSEDAAGRIWIASFLQGIYFYDPVTEKVVRCDANPFVTSGLITSDVLSIMTDTENNIWAGTSSGLFKINYIDKENGFTVTEMRNKMPNEANDHPSIHRISSLFQSKDGTIWAGTKSAGLQMYNREDDTFYLCKDRFGLQETSINAMIEDDYGSIWIGGKSGITRIDRKNKSSIRFTEADGLLTDYFNEGAIEKDMNGLLYFGSFSGINFIDPKNIVLNENTPELYFTNFKLFNKTVIANDENQILKRVISKTSSIELDYDQSVFSIEYMGTAYTRPERNQYAYILEGFDTDWNYVGNTRSATYTNLTSGEYVFKLKAANNDGVWNTKTLDLKINVLPPWWKSNTAYLLYIIAALSIIFVATWIIRNRIREKQTVMIERERRIQEERLNKTKLQFFTNISHEFRTPLTLIMNPISDIINRTGLELPELVRQKHHIIYKNSQRLSRLINELMDFRKLESNKIFIKAQQFDAVAHIREVLEFFQEETKYRNISLSFKTSKKELMVWADLNMLEKIIFNILSNAFKVTPEQGEIKVRLKEKEVLMENPVSKKKELMNTFQISIKDNGPGIDQKEYKRIFKRFYQVSRLNKDYYGSSGIGLEMVKGFVELHHGLIDVESELQKGTKFTITLPMGKEHFLENEIFDEEKERRSISKEQKIQTRLHKDTINDLDASLEKTHTVLIVEDNPELLSYIRDELLPYYNVITATNGKEGFDIAKEKSPHLIITDVVMPIMDGLEMCVQIKKDITTSHIPLLMLTARAMVEDRIKGIDSGADAYMNKPFNMDVLKATLAGLLTSRQILFDKYSKKGEIHPSKNSTTIDNEFIKKTLHYIHEKIEEPDLSVEMLASQLFLSRSQLYRKIKALTGLSVNEFIRKIRLEEAKKLIVSRENYNVNEIAFKVGFSSSSYFSKCFKKEFGHSPKKTLDS